MDETSNGNHRYAPALERVLGSVQADTREGVDRLAARIRAYWASKGLHPEVRVIEQRLAIKGQQLRICLAIKSDMLNGRPR